MVQQMNVLMVRANFTLYPKSHHINTTAPTRSQGQGKCEVQTDRFSGSVLCLLLLKYSEKRLSYWDSIRVGGEMEPVVVEPKRRGRKRKKIDEPNVMDSNVGKRVKETRSLKLVGRYVRKEFGCSGVFLGKVVCYNTGLYRINYEDGDFEDLDSMEVKGFLVEDCDLNGEWSERKAKLDALLFGKDVNEKILEVDALEAPKASEKILEADALEAPKASEKILEVDALGAPKASLADSSAQNEMSNGETSANVVMDVLNDSNDDANADVLSDSCEDFQGQDANVEIEGPLVPPPELPPSSGHIGIPEEYVSHLFAVHGFLRSFSLQLFLYPFGLDDFVGALNCSVANTLLDSVHVALLRVLKRHIERLSSEGSDLASKCLRCLDWSLLDNLTWPIYLVHYLMVMGYKRGTEGKKFYTHTLERDYYTLSSGQKLLLLQILCDDVMDSEELREEMEIRVESEVGVDADMDTVIRPIVGTSRIRSRYNKASASKGVEASISEHHDIKSSVDNHSTQLDEQVGSSADDDSNGDECRICGMDGLLLCCDGCPSSYHSRCLGLSKTHMPDGSWYCPECKIDATEPKIVRETALRGGHNFGVDPYRQVFVATCDHLLVLKASNNSEICLKYYKKHDIPRVLHCLYSNTEHAVTYMEICKGIMQYWELPEDILPSLQVSEVGMPVANKIGVGECNSYLDNLLETGCYQNGKNAADMAASSLPKSLQEPVENENSLDKVFISDQFGNEDSTRQQSVSNMNTSIVEHILFGGLTGHPDDTSELSKQSHLSVTGAVPNTTRTCHANNSGPACGATKGTNISRSHLRLTIKLDSKCHGNPSDGCSYTGSSFKTAGYINNYLHGDFAASAAAKLAILSSEESQVLEARSSNNRRKGMSDNISLQVKAFSAATTRFSWPNPEKKLVDIPRERCSWCFSCKATGSSKRGCLLNAAALNAIRGTAKVPAGVRPLKNGDSRLAGMTTYILYIEESLSSLVIGPFHNDSFRKRWRKQVEQASSCNAIKILLLELEENVRPIAFSGDWVKVVSGCSTQSSNVQIAANAAGSVQKRKPGRRGRKPSAVVEVSTDDCGDSSNNFTWWRGGTLSKLMSQTATLPRSMIRKAARQGGSKNIPGVQYVGGHETPKCSRQLIWRSAVEMSRNIAQLALQSSYLVISFLYFPDNTMVLHQIRYLDFHVRWSDLVRPEQGPPDGKGPDTEASAFRNASICDKKVLEHEIRYCVAFGSQKHLPSRVMKNVAEVEKFHDDGKERYWFSETRIPLYLIKDYEEKVGKSNSVDVLSKLQRRQRKASQKSIFYYLWRKQDNTAKSHCCSCHQDVLHWNAVKCSACQGLCHENCAISLTGHTNTEVNYVITCQRCSETLAINQAPHSYGSPTSPLLLQVPKAVTSSKRVKVVGHKASPASFEPQKRTKEMKSCNDSGTANKNKIRHWGLIWRKNNCEDTGADFRLENIILRGNPDKNPDRPNCCLCSKPYNAELMYIKCEACNRWFHAEALELDESQISNLLGYKCCRCRRLKRPHCPYSDEKKKKEKKKKMKGRNPKLDIQDMDSNSQSSFETFLEDGQLHPALHQNEEINHAVGDDTLLLSLSELEQCTQTSEPEHECNNSNASFSGPRKLLVRRHIKQENNNSPVPFEANFNSTGKLPVRKNAKREKSRSDCYPKLTKSLELKSRSDCFPETTNPLEFNYPLSSQAQWDVPDNSFDDSVILDFDGIGYDENTDFEPQTYFSFNELLAPDENESQENAVVGDLENLSVLPENEMVEILYDEEEPIVSVGTTFEIQPCKFCSLSEPCPELCCQVCGISVHSSCSPWLESSSLEECWKCGDCREWRILHKSYKILIRMHFLWLHKKNVCGGAIGLLWWDGDQNLQVQFDQHEGGGGGGGGGGVNLLRLEFDSLRLEID
ncbi:metalloendopeptidases [Striga asiatica]|uniref:Metalloendopeptidases n=1 Tax=Striga asiatica TaxID=4170 RepID=A0A5A7Q4F6_STRAF|nr:metalloendopeptidases [Striga asiatica]